MKNLLLFFMIVLGSAFHAQSLNPGLNTLDIEGRSADVITPANYDTGKTYPIVFFLHGLGGNKTSMQDANAVTEAQIIGVFPEGTSNPLLNGGRGWNSLSGAPAFVGNVDDVSYLALTFRYVAERLGASLDQEQVYSIGFSNGGSMNLKMIKNSSIFKAVVIGAMSEETGANGNIPGTASKVPQLWMIGMNDQVVPFTGGQGSFGPLATFEGVREAAKRWAVHNTGQSNYQQIMFEGNAGMAKYHFREYRDEAAKTAPVYQYMIPDAPHGFTSAPGFTLASILQTSMNFFKNPICYGLSRKVCQDNGMWKN